MEEIWHKYIYMISNSLPECLSSQLPIWRSAQQQIQPCKEQNQRPDFAVCCGLFVFLRGGGGIYNVYSEEHLLFITMHGWTLYCFCLLTFSS